MLLGDLGTNFVGLAFAHHSRLAPSFADPRCGDAPLMLVEERKKCYEVSVVSCPYLRL